MRAHRLIALAAVAASCVPPSYASFRDQLASRWCDRQIRCGELGGSESSRCGVPMPLSLVTPGSLDPAAEISAGRMLFHPDNAADCLDAVKRAPCDPAQAAVDLQRHCHGVVSGNVAVAAGPCFGDEECVGGACVGAECGGSCAPWAPAGAPCEVFGGPPERTCDPTVHYCDGSVCQHQKQSGETCLKNIECAFDLACVDGKCADPPRLRRDDVCGTRLPPCEDGLYCDETGACEPRPKEGDACVRPDACGDGLICVASSCTRWLDLGGACTTSPASGPSGCPASQQCSAGSCAGAAGMTKGKAAPLSACTVDGDCADGLWCGSGFCAYQGGIGATCAADHECIAGLRCDGSTCKTPVSCPAAL